MSKDEQNILSKIYTKLEGLEGSVETIRRGVYGDKDNNVLGLIQRQEIDEQERSAMKTAIQGIKNNIWKISAGAGLVGSFLIWVLKVLIA